MYFETNFKTGDRAIKMIVKEKEATFLSMKDKNDIAWLRISPKAVEGSYDYYGSHIEFKVRGINAKDPMSLKQEILERASLIRSLFRLEDAEVEKGKAVLKGRNVKGLIEMPEGLEKIVLIYNDGKRKAMIKATGWVFNTAVFRYKDEKENIYMFFEDDDAWLFEDLADFLDDISVFDRESAIKLANMFLASESFRSTIENIVDKIVKFF